MDIEKAITESAMQLGCETLQDEQRRVIISFVEGRDVFAALPFAEGTDICYACLPLVFDKVLTPEKPSVVAVITPLTVKHLVASYTAKGLSTAYLSCDSDAAVNHGILEGAFQLILISPEMLLSTKKWKKLLKGEEYSERLKALVVTEAHYIEKWGESYREALFQVGEMRSLLTASVKVMALTATARTAVTKSVLRIVGLHNPLILTISPCKKNIMYAVRSFKSIPITFGPLLEKLRKERQAFPRTVIYCQQLEECADLYLYFKYNLRNELTEPIGYPNLSRFRLVDMLHCCNTPDLKAQILESFSTQSQLRIVFVKYEHGVTLQCPDVRQIIHLGPPDDLESYIQETRSAGEDGEPALALLLMKKKRKFLDEYLDRYQSNMTDCRRDLLFSDMDHYEHLDMGVPCLCCDICAQQCTCGSCAVNHHSFMFVGK